MKTLSARCSFGETIRKSRFIAHAAPVKTQAETLEFYESVADPQATHNCWAWRIDLVHRSNDDGEPSGSAGRPILAAIEGHRLEQVMIVVTRYFGGIKLGIGGLVRAYGGCASKCLDRAKIIEWQPKIECSLHIDFALASAAHGLFEQFSVLKLEERFEPDGTMFRLSIPENRFGELQEALTGLSRGRARLQKTD